MRGDLILINHHLSPGHRLAGGLGQDGAVRDAVGGGGDGHGQEIKWEQPTVNFPFDHFILSLFF